MTELHFFENCVQFITIQNVCKIKMYLLIFVDMDQFLISIIHSFIHSFRRSLMNQSLEMLQKPSLHHVLTIHDMMPGHKIKCIFSMLIRVVCC